MRVRLSDLVGSLCGGNSCFSKSLLVVLVVVAWSHANGKETLTPEGTVGAATNVTVNCPDNCNQPHGYCWETSGKCQCLCIGESVCFQPPDCYGEYNKDDDWDYIDCHGGSWGGNIEAVLHSTEGRGADQATIPLIQASDYERYCICPELWLGIDCSVCQNTNSCLEPNDMFDASKDVECDRSIFVDMKKYFSCNVTSEELQNLLGGDGSTGFVCEFPGHSYNDGCDNDGGNCTVSFNVESTGPPLLFECILTGCYKRTSTKMEQTITCTGTKCTPTDYCNTLVFNAIKSATGTSVFSCDELMNCTFVQDSLEDLIGAVELVCLAGECNDIAFEPVPPIPNTLSRDEIIMIGTFIGFVAFSAIVAALLAVEHQYIMRTVSFTALDKFPAALSFNNVCCSIPIRATMDRGGVRFVQRTILRGVTGECFPGQVLAILGASGSGKTTLLDILSGRKNTGTVSGEVLVNGKPRGKDFRRVSGYVSQDDVMLGTLTCREHLNFAASLRLPAQLAAKTKQQRVEEVLQELELLDVADSFIGTSTTRGISGGERKRLNIATELMIAPAILFLDEPTSGLDSSTAFSLIQTLVKIARAKQRTVVMSIHQPRSNIYHLFDNAMVLAHGEMVFFGPAQTAVDFFSEAGFPCPAHYNPADFVIDTVKNIATVKQICAKKDLITAKLPPAEIPKDTHSVNASEAGDLYQRKIPAYSTSFWTQFCHLCKRTSLHILRNQFLLRFTYLLYTLVGLIIGILYWQMSNDLQHGGIQDRFGVIFFLITLISFGSITSIDLFFSERIIYLRERANGYYRPSAYFFAKTFCDLLPQRVIPPLILSCITYYMMGLRLDTVDHFIYFNLVMVLVSVVSSTLCLCISCVTPSVAMGNLFMILILFYSLLFGGFLIEKSAMPTGIYYLTYISFINYAFEALSVSEFDGLWVNFNPSGYDNTAINGAELLVNMGLNTDNMMLDIELLAAMAGAFIILGYLLLRFWIKEKR
ncbi:ABC transporter G family protein [Pelomyxa schiedti]|nr:ABC transporter G family protein [Pelomyxa schiedti]